MWCVNIELIALLHGARHWSRLGKEDLVTPTLRNPARQVLTCGGSQT
jgi:hypothetical protein